MIDSGWSVTSNRRARHTFAIILTGIGVAAAVSFSTAQTIPQPQPLKEFLEDHGWVSLPTPDRRMGPGSVIRVTKKDSAVSVQWLGDLRRCGITDGEFGFVRGKYPPIGIGKTFAVRASVATRYIGKLDGTADLGKASGAILQMEASGGDAVDVGALAAWLAMPNTPRRMSRVCNEFLVQEDTYLVTEAFRVSRAVYDLVDQNGGRLAVGGAAFGRTDPSSSGTLSVVEDLYVGVRHVKQLASVLFEPGPRPRPAPEADDLLRLMEP
jgi:hypothetical protein